MEEILYLILLLFISTMLQYLQDVSQLYITVAMLVIIACALILMIWKQPRYQNITFSICIVLSLYHASFALYLPILMFSYQKDNHFHIYYLSFIIPILVHVQELQVFVFFALLIEFIIAIFLKRQLILSQALEKEHLRQRDTSRETALLLDRQNHYLRLQQEQEIRIATLDERNRIAREIHDNVGHLLSSALLQIGAIQAIQKDEALKQPLEDLRQTISSGMDNVRNSVHDLHDKGIDLEAALQKIIHNFTFCECILEYNMIHPFQQEVIYHILAIVKECMNNTMKHSNATQIKICINEQPAFYQCIIVDNGTIYEENNKGIGLHNIKDRIHDLNGYVHISHNQGFQIHITLMKEDKA